jgi:hypothetical protein
MATTGSTNGHTHKYVVKGKAKSTSKDDGHTHPVRRNKDDKATSIGPGTKDGHKHSL